MEKLVSVIVPCYNQAKYLNECLESVFNQSYILWECIIINDGSTDETAEIANKWVERDNKFRYFFKENGGLSAARNTGLKLAKGEIILFLDSDDIISHDKLQRQTSHLNDCVDIVICNYFPFQFDIKEFFNDRYLNPFPSEENFKTEIISNWESKLSIPCHCILFKSSLLKSGEKIFFDETLPNHEDWLFWIKLFYYANSIFNLKETHAFYRIHSESMCSDTNKMKQGFLMACKKAIVFFEENNDRALLMQSKRKFSQLNIGFYDRISRLVKMFIPPVFYLLKNKFVQNVCQK